ncbi:MAG TPA: HepT-like ribonuclease domain-containing protein [Pirellulales bacterium]|nr:HepT-like ribonuclease domain-containing protein [Pirellulales bacterium]
MAAEGHDPGYLWDMLNAAHEIEEFVAGSNLEQYMHDRKLQLAVERGIEIIGEAARKVSKTFQEAHPEVPWVPIIAQRHVLAHDYGRIDHERVFRVATVHVPELATLLTPLIPPLPPDIVD